MSQGWIKFIAELVSRAAGSGSLGAAALNDKAFNHPVEGQTVIKISFAGGLLAAFFGLGLGTLLRRRTRWLVVFPLLLFLTVNVFLWYGRFNYGVSFSPDMLLWQMSFAQVNVTLAVFLALVVLGVSFSRVRVGYNWGSGVRGWTFGTEFPF